MNERIQPRPEFETRKNSLALMERYFITNVCAPEFSSERKKAHEGLGLSRAASSDELSDDMVDSLLSQIEEIATDLTQPSLAHLASHHALQYLLRRHMPAVDMQRVERIMDGTDNVIKSLDEPNAKLFRSMEDAKLHRIFLVGAYANTYDSLFSGTQEHTLFENENLINRQRLEVAGQILRTRGLHMALPYVTIESTRNDGVYASEGRFPETRMILSFLRLAREEKLGEACRYWGMQLKKDYQLMMPGALVSMETQREPKYSPTNQYIGRSAKLFYVRVPIIEGPVQSRAEESVSSLAYYIAVRAQRLSDDAIHRYDADTSMRKSEINKKYREHGERGVAEYYVDHYLESIKEPEMVDGHEYPSVIQTALHEYQTHFHVQLDPTEAIDQLRSSTLSLMLSPDWNAKGGFSMRSQEQIAENLSKRALEVVPVQDLSKFADEFINRQGEWSILTPDQYAYVEGMQDEVRELVRNLNMMLRTPEITLQEDEKQLYKEVVEGYASTLREFLGNIMIPRYETIRNAPDPIDPNDRWKK